MEQNTDYKLMNDQLLAQIKLLEIKMQPFLKVINQMEHLKQQTRGSKHVENVRQIEGAYQVCCNFLNTEDIVLCVGSDDVYFQNIKTSKDSMIFERKHLEALGLPLLADTIISAIKGIA